jgi:hypothetical protein
MSLLVSESINQIFTGSPCVPAQPDQHIQLLKYGVTHSYLMAGEISPELPERLEPLCPPAAGVSGCSAFFGELAGIALIEFFPPGTSCGAAFGEFFADPGTHGTDG